jgi:hypothetical protein
MEFDIHEVLSEEQKIFGVPGFPAIHCESLFVEGAFGSNEHKVVSARTLRSERRAAITTGRKKKVFVFRVNRSMERFLW